MNFQPVKHNDFRVEKAFVSFCLASKPYDFCSLPTMSARLFRIKDYYDFLLRNKECFFAEDKKGIRFFAAIERSATGVYVDFVFGPPFKLAADFKNFRQFYRGLHRQNFEFSTIIKRQHKQASFVKSIQKRDDSAKLFVDNQEIHVSWIL
jgi:hypothetical protein